MSPVVGAIVCFWKAREHHLYGCCHLGLPGIHTALGIQAGTGGLPVVSPPGLLKWGCSDLLVFYPSIFQAQWCGTSCQVESNAINYTALIVPALHLQQRRQETPLPGTQQNNQNKEQLFNSSASTTINILFNAHTHAHLTEEYRGQQDIAACPTQDSQKNRKLNLMLVIIKHYILSMGTPFLRQTWSCQSLR